MAQTIGTLLVTGFGPFPEVPDNASATVAERLAGQLIAHGRGSGAFGLEVVSVVLPTAYSEARRMIIRKVRDLRPLAVVALGVSPASQVQLESRARGVVGSDRADATGEVWAGRMLGADLQCAWPIADWVAQLSAASRPERLGVGLSDDCGGYVCNATYQALLEIMPASSLFVHIPNATDEASVTKAFATVRAILERVAAAVVGETDDAGGDSDDGADGGPARAS